MMLLEPLLAQASSQPETVAIVDDTGRRTYGELVSMAARLGKYLSTQTTRPRIGLLLPSSAGFVATFYGALLAGKTVVPINFLLSDRDIAYCIADSEIDLVVTVGPLVPRIKDIPLKVIDLGQLGPISTTDRIEPPPDASTTAREDDVAVLMYTSGTSGTPKGVLLSYGNLQSNVDASIAHCNFQSKHRFLGIVPLFHAFGMTAMMLAPLQLGATIVYMARFSPAGVVNAIREHAISLLGGVPSMFGAMLRLKEASREDFSSIYQLISGGEPLPAAFGEAFYARFGVTLYEAYGMTETSLAIALNTPQMHRPGSVGKPIPGMQVRIVDDQCNALPPGQAGEIWVKGPMVMSGYHKRPVESAGALTPDGWFKTGDLGKLDADGFLYITGRRKDLIIVAGEKVAPREVEEILAAHPAVAEAAVIGRKEPSRGEAVIAFVVPREGQSPDPPELRQFCRKRGLPAWKIPREIYAVPELPRSATGKILKQELRPPPSAG